MAEFIDNRPHALYRFFDAKGDLLYIGITWNIAARFPQHMEDKPWWGEIQNITIEQYPDRSTVMAAERDAIRTEHPRYNVAHRLTPARSMPRSNDDDSWPILAVSVPQLDLAARWVKRQAKAWTYFDTNRNWLCGLELWYGYPAVQPLVGDMGIRDLVTSLAGWGAGERVWPEESRGTVNGIELAALLNQKERPFGARSSTWMPPRDMSGHTSDKNFVRQVVLTGWNAPEVLRTTRAYDTVYDYFLTLMPECWNCACCLEETG